MVMRFAGAAHSINRASTLHSAPQTYLGIIPRRASRINSFGGSLHLVNNDRTTSLFITNQQGHYYSSTPSLFRRGRPRTYKSESLQNEKLMKTTITPKSDRIDALKRKIKDLSEGRVVERLELPKPRKIERSPSSVEGRERKPRHVPRHANNAKSKSRRPTSKREPKQQPFRERDQFEEVAPRPIGKGKSKNARVPNQKRELYANTKPNPLRAPYSVFISCLPGLEPTLLQEVQYLQSQWEGQQQQVSTVKKSKTKIIRGGVKVIVPSLPHLYMLHLYLGTASHIYLRLNDDAIHGSPLFRARGFPELKRKLKDLMVTQRWERLLDIPSHSRYTLPFDLQIHVTTSKSKLMHTKAVEERVRETIGEVLGIDVPKSAKSTSEEDGEGDKKDTWWDRPTVRLFVRIERDLVQLSLDASSSSEGTPLHMRGYRLNPFKAPLREDLAFGLLMAGGLKPSWNLEPLQSLLHGDDNTGDAKSDDTTKSVAAASLKLFDPFCGSGTIAIEGASVMAGLPPGRFRSPPLQGTRLCDPKLWDAMKLKVLGAASSAQGGKGDSEMVIGDEEENNDGVLVAANDINKGAIEAAKSNAKRAGVEQFIDFYTGSFKNHPLLKQKSSSNMSQSNNDLLVVTNPPYGKRLPSPDNASSASTYKQLARALRSSPSEIAYCTLIGKDIRALRESSLPLKVAFSTKQGGLSVVAMTGGIDKASNE